MDLPQWLDRIQSLHPLSWDLGLDRVELVGSKMNLLKPAGRVILVAGTNGKGSTCEYLAQFCRIKGLSYGKSTSPFLLAYNEQFVVDNQPVADEEIVNALESIDSSRGEISLSYFEFGALAAMQIFKQRKVDIAILEIGLGGRLDAMNIVDPDVSIITKLAMDHEEWLGNNLEKIAVEKAGVMRQGKPVICVDPTPPSTIDSEIKRQEAIPYRLGKEFSFEASTLTIQNESFNIPAGHLPEYSAIAAIVAMKSLGLMPDQTEINAVLSNTRLPGRLQIIPGAPDIILDVAHNPNAAERLAKKLSALDAAGFHAVVGVYKDKDVEGVFQHLAPLVSSWHFPLLAQPRASSGDLLNQHLSNCSGSTGQTYATVSQAFEAAKSQCSNGEILLVFGSFPIVAGVLRHLGDSAFQV